MLAVPSSTTAAWRWAASATAAIALFSSIQVAQAQSTCNGHAELCSRSYSNISYVGAHNSYSVQAGSLAANQNYDVTTQLDNGIRLLQGQGHLNNGDIHLCHSSCLLLDAGTMTDYLGKVRSWLDANPNEVITILWVNSGGIPVSQWAQSYTAVGLDALSYTPASVPVAYSAWPTLQELISSGKRVVNFMDYGADYSTVPYILDHFAHFWENPYDQTDDSFPCTIDRGSGETPMYMINHYLDKNMTFFGQQIPVPDTSRVAEVNAASGSASLGENAAECAAQHGQNPTYLLVDFYDEGDGSVFQVAADLNGVTHQTVAMGNGTSVSTGSSNSSSTSGTGNTSGRSGSVSSTSNNTGGAAVRIGGVGATVLVGLAAALLF